jgi:hypothetical protein
MVDRVKSQRGHGSLDVEGDRANVPFPDPVRFDISDP